MPGNILAQQAASGTFTLTAASLASSSSKVAGRESTVVATDTDDYLDFLVGGKVTTGTTPTVNKSIDVWVYGALNDTPVYPVKITGSDAGATYDSENQRNAALKPLPPIVVDATSDRTYSFGPYGIAQLFGGVLPTDFGLWIVHDTVAALNATGGNHAFYYTGVYARYT